MAGTLYGDPLAQPDVAMGPLVSQAGLDKVAGMVDRARAAGASIVQGGRKAAPEAIAARITAVPGLEVRETYVNREHFEAMQGFHAGRKKSGIGGADGKHGLYEFTETHVVYIQHG